jgi:hypothetical protein
MAAIATVTVTVPSPSASIAVVAGNDLVHVRIRHGLRLDYRSGSCVFLHFRRAGEAHGSDSHGRRKNNYPHLPLHKGGTPAEGDRIGDRPPQRQSLIGKMVNTGSFSNTLRVRVGSVAGVEELNLFVTG